MLDNERLAINYLYNGRIAGWLEQCGNVKLSSVVKDIVVNRYPADQHAGLMASIYVMEPTYPYKDLHGNQCDDLHSVSISVLSYQEEYAMALRNRILKPTSTVCAAISQRRNSKDVWPFCDWFMR